MINVFVDFGHHLCRQLFVFELNLSDNVTTG